MIHMIVLRKILLQAASIVATDPRVHAKAADLYKRKVKPAAEETLRAAKPKLDAAKAQAQKAAAEIEPLKARAEKSVVELANKVRRRLTGRDGGRGAGRDE